MLNLSILAQVAAGCLNCGQLRRLPVFNGPEFAALVFGDELPLLIVKKSALFHALFPCLRFLVALQLG